METSSNKRLPWELIAESFTGEITTEGELLLQRWLSADSDNNSRYRKLERIWKNGMEDYRYYKMADEHEAWKKLQIKLGKHSFRFGGSTRNQRTFQSPVIRTKKNICGGSRFCRFNRSRNMVICSKK